MAVVPGTNHATPAPATVRFYVWAGTGRDEVPGRVEMTRCDVCRLLVEATEAAAHTAWHKAVAL